MSRNERPRGSLAHTPDGARTTAAFLRELASRVEDDPQLANEVADALRQYRLLIPDEVISRRSPPTPQTAAPPTSRVRRRHDIAEPPAGSALDPFHVLRSEGEQALRTALLALDLPALRLLVRTHHLDPNRVSARWSARERIIALIVDQVRARAHHGRSFERI